MEDIRALAMFPLGTVLLPGGVLPLHVFEPRYRALVHDCLRGDPEFGVVLITRGSEVGGGETRSDVGTVARLVEVAELGDGRFAVVALGTRRIRVERWLPDDPYPRAEVRDWPDEPASPDLGARVAPVVARLRRVLAAVAELGRPAAPATTDLADDPVLASYQASVLAPLGPADQYDLLTQPGPEARLALLDRMLEDAEELAQFELRAARPEAPDAGDS